MQFSPPSFVPFCVVRLYIPSTVFTLYFQGIYIYALYQIPQLYVKVEHKLAHCCRVKYFQFEISKSYDFQL